MSRKNNPAWAEWFVKAQNGNKGAYEKLLLEICPVVRKFVSNYIKDPKKVDDVLQDTLLKMHVSRHTFQPGKPFEPWMYAVARSAVNNHLRGDYTYRAHISHSDENTPEGSQEASQHLAVDTQRALDKLSPKYQQALKMVKLQGLSMEEAAQRLGMTEGAFKVLAHRAYKKFKEALEETKNAS